MPPARPPACRRPVDAAQPLRLGLAGEHQKVNASLALTLAATWEARSPVAAAKQGERAAQRAQQLLQGGVVAPEYAAGLALAQWPGRAQVRGMQAQAAAAHSAMLLL